MSLARSPRSPGRGWGGRRYWLRFGYMNEWHATGSLWSADWEAGEIEALRAALGLCPVLERAPQVASDADLVWQPAPNSAGFRPYHTAFWHHEPATGKCDDEPA